MASANLPGDLIAWAINMTHPEMEWSADQCEPAIEAARLILAAVGLDVPAPIEPSLANTMMALRRELATQGIGKAEPVAAPAILPGSILRVQPWPTPNGWHVSVDYTPGIEYEHIAGIATAALVRKLSESGVGGSALRQVRARFVVGGSGALYSDDDVPGADIRHLTFVESYATEDSKPFVQPHHATFVRES